MDIGGIGDLSLRIDMAATSAILMHNALVNAIVAPAGLVLLTGAVGGPLPVQSLVQASPTRREPSPAREPGLSRLVWPQHGRV